MTRAEQRALEAYPEDISYSTVLERPFDYNGHQRMIFQKGYEQAEKDFADVAQVSSGQDGFYYGKGYQQAEKDLGWHPVDESLPPMDEEVIVLLGEWNEVSIEPLYRITFGHVVNKEYCEDYNGWNIPGVSYWMPMPEIPKEK